jgi:uncharacterized membrane protein
MRQLQYSWSQLLLLLLSLVGAAIAIYLTTVHYENAPLLCSTTGLIDCSRVLSSPYSVVPGTSLPITIPGLAWSLISAVLAVAGLRQTQLQALRRIYLAQFIWSLLALVIVLYLVYLELVVLHTICAWCTAMHAVILIMFLITIVQLQQGKEEAEAYNDESVPDRASMRR